MKECPRCKLKSPDVAQRCDCGYEFDTRTVETPDRAGGGATGDLTAATAAKCAACGLPAEAGRQVPLCASCRAKLAMRPFPGSIKVAAGVIGVLLLIAMAQFPASLSASISYERGQRAEAKGAFGVAVSEYTRTVERFPNSTLATARKGIAAFHAGQFDVAAEALQAIGGREGSPETVREVNAIISRMQSDHPERR